MTRLMLVVLLASVAVTGTGCTDESPVGPSARPGAFKNELTFAPDAASACTARTWPDPASRPGKC